MNDRESHGFVRQAIGSKTSKPGFSDLPLDTLVKGDCLEVMSFLPDACVDLIYVDPPFATGKARRGDRLAIGPGGRIRDKDPEKTYIFSDRWAGGLDEYLQWLEPRLEEMARLLAPTGGLMVHLDGHASHYVKVMLDRILGAERFINEIIWHYKSGGHPKKRLARKFDSILWYAKGKTHIYHPEAAALPRNRCRLCGETQKRTNHMKRREDEKGRSMITIKSAGRIYSYYEDAPAPPCDVWLDIGHLHQRDPERTGYPTQKPLKLLKRIVGLASNPGDVVADFFAGTGTTLIASAQLGRRWLGSEARLEAADVAAARFTELSLPFRVMEGSGIRSGRASGSHAVEAATDEEAPALDPKGSTEAGERSFGEAGSAKAGLQE